MTDNTKLIATIKEWLKELTPEERAQIHEEYCKRFYLYCFFNEKILKGYYSIDDKINKLYEKFSDTHDVYEK